MYSDDFPWLAMDVINDYESLIYITNSW